jgi:hypothetical protein
MLMKKLLWIVPLPLLLLALLGFLQLFDLHFDGAKDVRFRGIVSDRHGTPIQSTTISILDPPSRTLLASTLTDATGSFEIYLPKFAFWGIDPTLGRMKCQYYDFQIAATADGYPPHQHLCSDVSVDRDAPGVQVLDLGTIQLEPLPPQASEQRQSATR